jgi:type II secretory pathway pseudopilin PulG
MVEVLMAVVFLGACASSILACVSATSTRMREVEQREVVLATVQSQMEAFVASVRRAVPTPSNSTVQASLPGISKQVSINRKIELLAGTTDVYLIDVTASWNATASKTDRAQVLRMTTYMRSPYG